MTRAPLDWRRRAPVGRDDTLEGGLHLGERGAALYSLEVMAYAAP
jgi:hypothetical protein